MIRPDQHAQRGRLAGAVRAEQADDLASLDPEADAVDRAVAVAVLLDEVVDRDRHVGEIRVRSAGPPATSSPPGDTGNHEQYRDDSGDEPGERPPGAHSMPVHGGDRQRLRAAPGERDCVGARIYGQSVGEVGCGNREHQPVSGRDQPHH